MGHVESAVLHVEVVYCAVPGAVDSVTLTLPDGARVSAALAASGLLQRHALSLNALRVGVWCRVQDLSTPLRDRDRVELYRPLTVDPKEARRLRYKRAQKKG